MWMNENGCLSMNSNSKVEHWFPLSLHSLQFNERKWLFSPHEAFTIAMQWQYISSDHSHFQLCLLWGEISFDGNVKNKVACYVMRAWVYRKLYVFVFVFKTIGKGKTIDFKRWSTTVSALQNLFRGMMQTMTYAVVSSSSLKLTYFWRFEFVHKIIFLQSRGNGIIFCFHVIDKLCSTGNRNKCSYQISETYIRKSHSLLVQQFLEFIYFFDRRTMSKSIWKYKTMRYFNKDTLALH